MKLARTWRFIACTVGTAAGFFLLLYLGAAVMRPDMSKALPPPPANKVREAEESRRIAIDPKNPQVIYREVDYQQGAAAPWYPKNEATILHDLVEAGKLPPLEQRMPTEPLVLAGVEGIGTYGGTWIRAANADSDVSIVGARLAYANLVRWSPMGYPIVPHIARSWTVSPDNKEFTFTLRKGMRWSDGHPFTADDIMYWWDCEFNYKPSAPPRRRG